MFQRIVYTKLNPRQKENYNFHKAAARLADYGFNSIRLTDDWQGADFIAIHVDGETFFKVQLKGRLTINKKYLGRAIHIAFLHGDELYFYDHDQLVRHVEANGLIGPDSNTWHQKGIRSWSSMPSWARDYLVTYRIA
jgi:hypothetical protein